MENFRDFSLLDNRIEHNNYWWRRRIIQNADNGPINPIIMHAVLASSRMLLL